MTNSKTIGSNLLLPNEYSDYIHATDMDIDEYKNLLSEINYELEEAIPDNELNELNFEEK